MAPLEPLSRPVLSAPGVVGKEHPRQTSADDDVGKCRGGDRREAIDELHAGHEVRFDVRARAWRERRGDELLHRVG